MTAKPTKTIFVSYAHEDKDYTDLLIKGLKRNLKSSGEFEWKLWNFSEIPLGTKWHDQIKYQVDGCDFALLLVSDRFLDSDYIQQEELAAFLDRQEKNGFLFFPVLLRPIDFTKWPQLTRFQFFMPNGDNFGKPTLKNISYADLIAFRETDGQVIQSPHHDRYHQELSKEIMRAVHELEKKTRKQWFKMFKHSEDLMPADIMGPGIRSKINKDYYWERNFDTEILNLIKENKSLLILGNSLAGKTRALFESLKKIDNALILIPPDNLKENENIDLPESNGKQLIAVFDDIDQYLDRYGRETFVSLINKLMEANYLLAATCRRGNEYSEFFTQAPSFLIDSLETVEIDKMSDADIKGFKNFYSQNMKGKVQLDERAFDRNIGSFFMKLTIMEQRYVNLGKILNQHRLNIPYNLPREILKAIKYFYYTGNMEGKMLFSLSKLKDFCERRMLGKRKETKPQQQLKTGWQNQLDNFMTRESKHQYSTTDWNQAIELLSSTRYDLNFIDVMEPCVRIEEVYLERIIERELNLNSIIAIIRDAYKDEDIQEYGFLTTVYSFTKLLKSVETLQEGEKIVQRMKNLGIKPNEVTFNTLINKTPNFAEALQLLDQMVKQGIKPDEVTFTTLMNKTGNFTEASQLLEQMVGQGIKPNEVTFTTLMNKTENFAESSQLLEQMVKQGIKPDEVTFNTLMNKTSNFAEASQLLEQMVGQGIKPDEVTFTTLMNKTGNFAEASQLLEQMIGLGIKPDEVTFTTLMNKTGNFTEASQLLDQMVKQDIKPNEVTFNTLLNKTTNFAEASQLLEQMVKLGIKPDEVTFTTLMNKTGNFAEASQLLEQMVKQDIKPDEVTFTTLLNKAENYTEALHTLDRMIGIGIKPDNITFNSLMNKAENFAGAAYVLEQMINQGIKPNSITFNSLLNKAETYADASQILGHMTNQGIKADSNTYNTIINKTETVEETLEAYGQMKALKLRTDKYTLAAVLRKTRLNQGLALEMIFKSYSPTDIFSDFILSHVVGESCKTDDQFTTYFFPYLETISKQKDFIITQFCRKLEYKGLNSAALELLESVKSKNFDYFNIKANCLKDTDFGQALSLYQKAIAATKDERQKSIVYNNAAQLIYNHKQESHYPKAIEYCSNALKIQPFYKFEYPGDLLVLFAARQHPADKLIDEIKKLVKTYRIPRKRIIQLADERIESTEIKELLKTHFSTVPTPETAAENLEV